MKAQDIIVWILFIISITLALWYLFGDSPTIEQALLVMILTMLFAVNSRTIRTESKLQHFKQSFISLAKDFKQHIHK